MNHEFLMALTANMPMRTIQVNGSDYLHRYYVGPADGGGQFWLHHFLREDSELHLHSHSFEARSMILCGGYKEHSRSPSHPLDGTHDHFRYYRPGDYNVIYRETLHRIVQVEPNTWSLLHVKPGRAEQWYFIDDAGRKQMMDSGGEDWWKSCGVREAA